MAGSTVLVMALLLLLLSLSHTVDVCSLVNKDQLKVVSANKMGFADANAWAAGRCDAGRLPDICSNQEDFGNNISTWIAMRRISIHLQWITGFKVGTGIFPKKKTIRERHPRNHGCGLFHGGTGYISLYYCLINGPAALCEIQGNNDYDCSLEGYWCTPIEGQCFCVANALNWYDARVICKHIGGSLAILLTESQRKGIISTLKRNPPVIMTNNFLWIGLHGEDWQETSGPRAGKPVMIHKFAPVDISNPTPGNCAVLKNNTWHVASCQGKNHAVSVCAEKDGENRQVTLSTWTGKSGYQREYSHVSITVVVIELSLIQWITAVN